MLREHPPHQRNRCFQFQSNHPRSWGANFLSIYAAGDTAATLADNSSIGTCILKNLQHKAQGAGQATGPIPAPSFVHAVLGGRLECSENNMPATQFGTEMEAPRHSVPCGDSATPPWWHRAPGARSKRSLPTCSGLLGPGWNPPTPASVCSCPHLDGLGGS